MSSIKLTAADRRMLSAGRFDDFTRREWSAIESAARLVSAGLLRFNSDRELELTPNGHEAVRRGD